MLSRLRQALPLAAGPLVLGAHLGAEALVSGRSLYSIAVEPLHVYLFVLAAATAPLWLLAARRRCLRFALVVAVASTLGLEGNGLGTAALITALVLGSILAWVGGFAIERAAVPTSEIPPRLLDRKVAPIPVLQLVPLQGPYFAFVPVRGNRPPPQLL